MINRRCKQTDGPGATTELSRFIWESTIRESALTNSVLAGREEMIITCHHTFHFTESLPGSRDKHQ
jgi:hypothetical protein